MQWIRACVVQVYLDGTNPTDLPDGLRIRFAVNKATVQTPNTAIITAYNMSDESYRAIRKATGKRITLRAGYADASSVIFDGRIKQVRYGRDNPTDTWVEIAAADGDAAYRYSTVNTSLAAGWTREQQLDALIAALATEGVTLGYRPDTLGGQAAPRGLIMNGPTRLYLADLCRAAGCDWYIEDGRVFVVPRRSAIGTDAVVLTARTGLIGIPQQTDIGILATALINPNLRMGGVVQINNASVQEYQLPLAYASAPNPPEIAADGLYKIVALDYIGDTRETPWYAQMILVALDGTITPALVRTGIILASP